jgi:hypothetical protein
VLEVLNVKLMDRNAGSRILLTKIKIINHNSQFNSSFVLKLLSQSTQLLSFGSAGENTYSFGVDWLGIYRGFKEFVSQRLKLLVGLHRGDAPITILMHHVVDYWAKF